MHSSANTQDENQRIPKPDLNVVYMPTEERFDRITKLACKIFNVPTAILSFVNGQEIWLKSLQGWNNSNSHYDKYPFAKIIDADKTLIVPDTKHDLTYANCSIVKDQHPMRFYAGHPVKYEGNNMGTISIIDRRPREFSSDDAETLKSLACWVENELNISALKNVKTQLVSALEQACRISMIDALTKTWNRRGIDDLLRKEMERARREKLAFAVLMVDIDYFKKINDQFGHKAGDKALQEIASRIHLTVRPNDAVSRYGGDEFLIFLGNCSEKKADLIANRIINRIQEKPVILDNNHAIDISLTIGVAAVNTICNAKLIEIIDMADRALYEGKLAGRNCVRMKKLHNS